jgi:Bacterial proteasome activator
MVRLAQRGLDPTGQETTMSNQEPEILMPAEGAPREGGEFVAQPAKLLRIASMIRELLEEVRKSSPDEAGRKRLRTIHGKALAALKEGLSEDLQKELETLTIPLDGTPSESEIRLAQAQLVGWLEGLFHGIQAALWAQHMQTRAQLDEMRRRGLPPGSPEGPGSSHVPGQYL